MSHKTLTARLVGFFSSIVFTVTAFLIVAFPHYFGFSLGMNIVMLFLLAILQFIAQSICFLNVLGEEGFRWNLILYLSTLAMILIIVLFSIWIMNHLNYNMMSQLQNSSTCKIALLSQIETPLPRLPSLG